MLLKSIEGVKEVAAQQTRDKGAYSYELVTIKNRDLREKIIESIFQNEFKLLEIHRESVSLEEIFNQVTKSNSLF